MNLSTIIKNYRLANNLTMQEFADACGLSKGYISMLENGRHPRNNKEVIPSLDTYRKLSEAMNVLLDDLLHSLDIEYGYHDKDEKCFKFFFPEDEYTKQLNDAVSNLNDAGKQELIKYTKLLSASDEYRKED